MKAAQDEKEAVYLQLGLTPMGPSEKFVKALKKAQKAAGVVTPKHDERVPFWQTREYRTAHEARKKERDERDKREAAETAAATQLAVKEVVVAKKRPAKKKPVAKTPAAKKTTAKKAA